MTFFLFSIQFSSSLTKSSLACFEINVKSRFAREFPAEFFQPLAEEIRKKELLKKRKK